jgi:hypothetical protein
MRAISWRVHGAQGLRLQPHEPAVLNFKKTPLNGGPNNGSIKAIGQAAAAFRTPLIGDLLDRITLVPIPPSNAKTDPLYMLNVVVGISTAKSLLPRSCFAVADPTSVGVVTPALDCGDANILGDMV